MTKLFRCTLVLGAAVLIAGCGGGGDGYGGEPPRAVDEVPDSASASVRAMVDYLRTLVAQKTEDKEPLSIDRFAPPRPEDTEPEPLS